MRGLLPELVAPAGTPEKLRIALHFGADAVYLGLRRFSLRSYAGNFSEEELAWALGFAREQGRRVYVCVNVQPEDEELGALEATFDRLALLGPDGVVVADPGVFAIARARAPALALHLSTQAGVMNHRAARFWFEAGVRRIVLARELSLAQIGALNSALGPGQELEVFAHGAVCVGMSGRCFLSLYWAGPHRSPRRGTCAQPCRWPYLSGRSEQVPSEEDPLPRAVEIAEARCPERVHALTEDERGTYFFDSADLCSLPVLERLVDTGVRGLKLEGRTRSAHYVGVVVDVYRRALDLLAEGGPEALAHEREALLAELGRASRRPHSTHFLTGAERDPASLQPRGGSPIGGERVFLGVVVGSVDRGLVVELRNALSRGERIEVRDRGLVCEPSRAELETEDGTPSERAVPGQRVVLVGEFRSGSGALVRLVS